MTLVISLLTNEIVWISQKKMKLSYTIKDQEIKNEIIEGNSRNQVSFDCDLETDLNDIKLNWEFLNIDDSKGVMTIAEAFKNNIDPNFNMIDKNDFSFNIEVENKDKDMSGVKYFIKSKVKSIVFKNLKVISFSTKKKETLYDSKKFT